MQEFPIRELLVEIGEETKGQITALYVQTETGEWIPVRGDNQGRILTQPVSTLAEQVTEVNATGGTVTLLEDVSEIEIINTSSENGVFSVNGLQLTVPSKDKLRARIKGEPSNTITVSGATSYIINRYE